jgi:hypothetical protein
MVSVHLLCMQSKQNCVFAHCCAQVLPAHIFAQRQMQMLCTGLPKCVLVEWDETVARVLILEVDWGWIGAALDAFSACWQHVTTNKTVPPSDAWLKDEQHVLSTLFTRASKSCEECGARLKGEGMALQLDRRKGRDNMAFT